MYGCRHWLACLVYSFIFVYNFKLRKMKKYLLFLMCLAVLNTPFAQGTNLDLESWTPDPISGAYDDPDGWTTTNSFSAFGFPVQVVKNTTSPANGAASADIETALCTGCPAFGLDTNFFGVMYQEIPTTNTPVSVDVAWKYAPVGSDSAAIIVELTHYDVSISDRVVDALGYVFLGPSGIWTTANIPLFYLTADTPDTLTLYAASSGGPVFGTTPVAEIGSVLSVDDFVINQPATSMEEDVLADIDVLAMEDQVIIDLLEETNATATLIGLTGKVLKVKSFIGNRSILDTRSFASGVYLVHVRLESGQAITKKIFIK